MSPLLIVLVLPIICLYGQPTSPALSDSLRIDSLAKQLMRTGELDFNELSNHEMDKAFEVRELFGSRADQ